jgi:hypothetical protein
MGLAKPKLLLIITHSLLYFLLAAEGQWITNLPAPPSDALNDWHWRNPLPQGNSLFGITYGNGTFIAVGLWGDPDIC